MPEVVLNRAERDSFVVPEGSPGFAKAVQIVILATLGISLAAFFHGMFGVAPLTPGRVAFPSIQSGQERNPLELP